FALVEEFGVAELLAVLMESALRPLLAEGRTATLDTWVAYASKHRLDLPAQDLADAEINLRSGHYRRAEELAKRCARRLTDGHPLTSHSWATAAQAAHLFGRSEAAFELAREAEHSAAEEAEVEHALWLQFAASTETNTTP